MQNATPALQVARAQAISAWAMQAREVLIGCDGEARSGRPQSWRISLKPLHKTMGVVASSTWVHERGLDHSRMPHWFVEISISSDTPDTRFELNIYPEEWGYVFRRGVRVSSIRVTDVPFVHGLDEYRLLAETPSLDQIGDLLAKLEQRYDMVFQRGSSAVRSNLVRASAVVGRWLDSGP